jgi:hypothetical protein
MYGNVVPSPCDASFVAVRGGHSIDVDLSVDFGSVVIAILTVFAFPNFVNRRVQR